MRGQVQTTYGTDFDCIGEHVLANRLEKAVILTDGYASLKSDLQAELKRKEVKILTVLFGTKDNCPEFAPLGDVVDLEDITH